ncbi:hypothetical protein [Kitasatospora sp. NPDC098663]|uniref:hypothetical protein n=1 Tax=Kitasatospora sp. NPDC098663 TaxID=3364096 RepID=UPI0037F8CFD5
MLIKFFAAGPMDGDQVSDKICDLLDVFNSIPQFVANDDWQIDIMEAEEDETFEGHPDAEPGGWMIECAPRDGLNLQEVERVTTAIEAIVRETGGTKVSRLIEQEEE